MTKKLLILLLSCAAFACAHEKLTPEETDDQVSLCAYPPFAAKETFCQNDQRKGCEDCDDPEHNFLQFGKRSKDDFSAHYIDWKRYKAQFGLETTFIRFPYSPAVSQSNSLLTAYAYDHAVLYTFNGYLPPLAHIDPEKWFEEIILSFNHYPVSPLHHLICQAPNGDWIMDYVAHDQLQNLIIKGRAIVTHHNGYTLQCIKPNGIQDHFDYFLDYFSIKIKDD